MPTELSEVPKEQDGKKVIEYTPLFPTPLAQVTLDLPVEHMAKDILDLVKDEENYYGGYTTYYNQRNWEHVAGYKEMQEAVYGACVAYETEMKYPFDPEKGGMFMWFNVMRGKKGEMHGIHHHPCSRVSGTLYVKTSEKTAPIVFHNPTSPFRMHEPGISDVKDANMFNALQYPIQPKNNLLLMWPGWLYHEVPPLQQDTGDVRISISFNVDFLPPGVNVAR